jgi:hypothetical protein
VEITPHLAVQVVLAAAVLVLLPLKVQAVQVLQTSVVEVVVVMLFLLIKQAVLVALAS